jgi:type II secretory pathway pseudopilin PulG
MVFIMNLLYNRFKIIAIIWSDIMKKNKNKGFFLIETMVVIAIVAMVITFLFSSFSNVYNRFSLSESYNTVAALNAVSNVRQYVENKGVEYSVILEGNPYIELSSVVTLATDYYFSLLENLQVSKVYLIDTDAFFGDSANLEDFGINLRSYIDTLNEEEFKYILVLENKNAEYGYVPVYNYYLTLVGDEDYEYVSYVAQNDTFVEPGYEAKDRSGNDLNIYITGFVDTSILGTYYLNYNLEDLSLRRRVVVYTDTYDFNYTGDYQLFTAPISGTYTVELWGAQGGFDGGSDGAYTKGDITLLAGEKLYVYVGQNNNTANATSFNGSTGTAGGHPGGGATDVRLSSGNWNNITGLNSRIMVAAGGGAGYNSGPGGALTGMNGSVATGGTQTTGGTQEGAYGNGTFGVGGNGCGGGGGYYGGGGATCAGGSGGGSSFISGHTGCNAVIPTTVHTNQVMHYSGYTFSNTQMIAGNASMISPTGITETGHSGNGYARITLSSPNILNNLSNVRYVYTQTNGSTANAYNHWVELQIYDINGNNISEGLTSVTSSVTVSNWTKLTDGDINTANYITVGTTGLVWLVLDLGDEYDLSSIRLWHYYNDGRTYHENEVRVAGNDEVYRTVMDIDYAENSYGRIVRAVNVE